MSSAHRANRMMNPHVALMTRALVTLAQAAAFAAYLVGLGFGLPLALSLIFGG